MPTLKDAKQSAFSWLDFSLFVYYSSLNCLSLQWGAKEIVLKPVSPCFIWKEKSILCVSNGFLSTRTEDQKSKFFMKPSFPKNKLTKILDKIIMVNILELMCCDKFVALRWKTLCTWYSVHNRAVVGPDCLTAGVPGLLFWGSFSASAASTVSTAAFCAAGNSFPAAHYWDRTLLHTLDSG